MLYWMISACWHVQPFKYFCLKCIGPEGGDQVLCTKVLKYFFESIKKYLSTDVYFMYMFVYLSTLEK